MVQRDVQVDDEEGSTFQDMLLEADPTKHTEFRAPTVSNGTTAADYEDDVPQLETVADRRMRRKSHFIVYLTIFIMSIGFSIVLTGVWPYLQLLDPHATKEFLGWVIAANPLGQMLAAPFLGWCGNRVGSNRIPFIITILMFIMGNALYALLPLFKENVKYVMVASRFIVGVSSANIAVCRSYIASSTKVKERTTAISITAAAQSMGFILGPGIQTGTALAFRKYNNDSSSLPGVNPLLTENGIPWNLYSSVGWIAIVMGIINLCLVMPCSFQEHFIAQKEALANRMTLLDRKDNDNSSLKNVKPDYIVVAAILYGFFISQSIYSLLESLLVPMILDLYAWRHETAVIIFGFGLSIAGVMTVLMYVFSGFLAKRIDERKIYLFIGFLPMTIAMLIHFPVGHTLPGISNCNVSMIERSLSTNFSSGIDGSFSLADNILNVSLNNNSVDLLNRRKRFVIDAPTNCSLGCPSTQKWCYYIPIIEKPQLAVGEFLAFLGFPMAFAFSTVLYSKVLGPQPQGFWMGVLTSVGSVGRVLGPLVILHIYTHFGTRWTFGSLFIVLLFTFSLLLFLYKRLVPMNVHHMETQPVNSNKCI